MAPRINDRVARHFAEKAQNAPSTEADEAFGDDFDPAGHPPSPKLATSETIKNAPRRKYEEGPIPRMTPVESAAIPRRSARRTGPMIPGAADAIPLPSNPAGAQTTGGDTCGGEDRIVYLLEKSFEATPETDFSMGDDSPAAHAAALPRNAITSHITHSATDKVIKAIDGVMADHKWEFLVCRGVFYSRAQVCTRMYEMIKVHEDMQFVVGTPYRCEWLYSERTDRIDERIKEHIGLLAIMHWDFDAGCFNPELDLPLPWDTVAEFLNATAAFSKWNFTKREWAVAVA